MQYNDFLEKTLRKKEKKIMKVKNSWGVYDAYKYIRKHKWFNIGRPVTEHEFYSIIRKVNKLLAENFSNGDSIYFPYAMGKLEIRKEKRGVFFNKDKKLINTYPINWNQTMRLWYEDEEARNNKTLVRMETKFLYTIFYDKYNANYKNQCFYSFTPNRFMKKALTNNVIKGKIDTLW